MSAGFRLEHGELVAEPIAKVAAKRTEAKSLRSIKEKAWPKY
jgi:hypothetical protein